MPKLKVIPKCHPESIHFAKGFCRLCYLKDYCSKPENKERLRKLRNKNYVINKEFYKERSTTWTKNNPESVLIRTAKQRAKKNGLEFSLTRQDITIPAICPVLGIPLVYQSGKFAHNSPSIDRIDNKKGYTKDNVIVISFRANSLKKDATLEELRKIADFYSALQ